MITISRSLGVVTFKCGGVRHRWSPIAFPALSRGVLFLLRLQLVQQGVEALEAPLPELAVALEPVGGLGERLGLEPARPPLRVAAARNQPGALEHLEVLGDRGLAHRERLGELRHRGLARREPGEDRPAGGIGERRERRVEAGRALVRS